MDKGPSLIEAATERMCRLLKVGSILK